MARHLVERGELGGRWYYQGQAFRIAPLGAQASHPSEFLQIGIEVFGGPDDASADAEIATLAPDPARLLEQLRGWALKLGFSQIGVADVDLASAEPGLQAWLAAGCHGDMA